MQKNPPADELARLERKGQKDAPIVAVPGGDVQKLVRVARDERYRVAVLLAAEAGLRIGEILGLQWEGIQAGEIRVRRAVACDISLMAITETGPSRSPKPDHRDHGERWTVMNHLAVDFGS